MILAGKTEAGFCIRGRRSTRLWCAQCGSEVDVVALKEAETLTGDDTTDTANRSSSQRLAFL